MPTAHSRAGWRKSSYSAQHNGCVEVDFTDEGVEVRDDKITESPVIRFSFEQWSHWLGEIVDDITNTNGAVTVTTRESTWLVHEPTTGATLAFSQQEWTAFRLGVIAGEFTPSSVATLAAS
ncbi:hypothetical protein GCM10009676_18690 [Prauserella halophila]|uniref:DUF397 domain-containing protein n=1 Tax=Prauserella halophila TaxID=185641 RepID=A0ABN1W6R4_9PSEU|nr:DUF397 domain-containing protein [Prauserella halophila]MCP2235929.1 protein of unknown function (DUF397) [Prauserella halophila]